MTTDQGERAKVAQVARSFIGTPYHDCGKVKGPNGGVDCATSVGMIYVEAGLETEIVIPRYSPQWYLHHSEEKYIEIILNYCNEIAAEAAGVGDLVVYKFGRCFAHGGIIIDPGFPSIIHAFKQAGMVTFGEGDSGTLANRERRFFSPRAWSR